MLQFFVVGVLWRYIDLSNDHAAKFVDLLTRSWYQSNIKCYAALATDCTDVHGVLEETASCQMMSS